MPTAEKKAVLDEITEKLNSANGIYITKYTGMSVADADDLVDKTFPFRPQRRHLLQSLQE